MTTRFGIIAPNQIPDIEFLHFPDSRFGKKLGRPILRIEVFFVCLGLRPKDPTGGCAPWPPLMGGATPPSTPRRAAAPPATIGLYLNYSAFGSPNSTLTMVLDFDTGPFPRRVACPGHRGYDRIKMVFVCNGFSF